jgi:hypothetical protein
LAERPPRVPKNYVYARSIRGLNVELIAAGWIIVCLTLIGVAVWVLKGHGDAEEPRRLPPEKESRGGQKTTTESEK